MKYINIIFTLIITLLLFSCSKEGDLAQDNVQNIDLTWEEPSKEEQELMEGSYATVKGFECGDDITRSSWIFDSQKLVFGWLQGDRIGTFPTSVIALKPTEEEQTWADKNPNSGLLEPTEGNTHPLFDKDKETTICRTDPEKTNVVQFVIPSPNANSQTAKMYATDGDFEWNINNRWSAYYPYSLNGNSTAEAPKYNHMSFIFQKDSETESERIIQTQDGIPDISAYKKGTSGTGTGAQNTAYIASEATACKHLGDFDVMISPETELEGVENPRINLQLRHVGAVARFYLLAPKNRNLVITNIKLICDKKIFYKAGKFTLKSQPYTEEESKNYGVKLVGDEGSQVTPEGELTNMLQMNFKDGTAKTYYDASNSYKRYITAYMMMYPITYTAATDGNLYAYVTAYEQGDSEKKEIHFVSNALADKTMVSGKYYQWTSATHEADGLYPIELTATLLPWQDIVGGNIDTDLTK